MHCACIKPIVSLHISRPLTMSETAVLALARQHREQQLSLEQPINALASGELQTIENQMQRVCVVLRTDAPLVWPGVAIFVNPAMDQVAVQIGRLTIARVRAEQEIALSLDRRQSLQLVDERGGQ